MSDTKVCSKCGEEKPREAFNRDSSRRDGLQRQCKKCKAKYNSDNREKIRARRAVYYAANRGRIAAYRAANRECSAAKRAVYYAANREKFAVRNAARYAANREYFAARYAANRETIAAQRAAYKKTPSGRAVSRAASARRRARKAGLPHVPYQLAEIVARDIDAYGFVACWMCGVELGDDDKPHLDHLIPVAADPDQLAALGVENPGDVSENLELACGTCNSRKNSRVMLCAVARYLQNAIGSRA